MMWYSLLRQWPHQSLHRSHSSPGKMTKLEGNPTAMPTAGLPERTDRNVNSQVPASPAGRKEKLKMSSLYKKDQVHDKEYLLSIYHHIIYSLSRPNRFLKPVRPNGAIAVKF